MTEEQKELLLKDLCARLPYGIRGKYIDKFYKEGMPFDPLVDNILISYKNPFSLLNGTIKPYLFPLSSMTEEQKTYISNRWGVNENFDFEINPNWGEYFVDLGDAIKFINWLNENHFDYRGLIPKGLAIDATNLNIY